MSPYEYTVYYASSEFRPWCKFILHSDNQIILSYRGIKKKKESPAFMIVMPGM